jgi:methionyl-tRNA formyltransferase
VTKSPSPVGRNQQIEYSAVDKWAHSHKIPIYYDPNTLLKEGVKFDLGIISDYGKIISKEVIDLFEKGILNIHFSILPKNRGASPVQAAILSGDKEVGVSIFKIDEKLDHGPVITQFKEEIKSQDTWESLKIRLFERTKAVLTELITPYLRGKINLKQQDEKEATYTSLIKKEHGLIPVKYLYAALQGRTLREKWIIPFMKDFSIEPSPENIERFIRAMQPWPGAWTLLRLPASPNRGESTHDGQAKRLKILTAHCDGEKLVIDEVQLEGKDPVSWKQFTEGHPKAKLED